MTSYGDMAAGVVDTLVDHLRNGASGSDWSLPWHTAAFQLPTNATTGRTYRGINFLSLASAALDRGYRHGTWATYRQWSNLSTDGEAVHVRKSERGTQIIAVFEARDDDPDNDDTAEQQPKRKRVRVFTVFNAAQVDGYQPTDPAPAGTADRVASAEHWVNATGAIVRYGFDRAYYRYDIDEVCVPDIDQYNDATDHYATLAHELIHWTGHRSRLSRPVGGADTAEYALEELVAELGSAIVCCTLGLTPVARRDHACYLAHWIDQLQEDPTILVKVAAAAQRAADFLNPGPHAATGSFSCQG